MRVYEANRGSFIHKEHLIHGGTFKVLNREVNSKSNSTIKR